MKKALQSKIGLWVALVLVGIAAAGCASFEQRGIAAFNPDDPSPWTIYPGAKHDARIVRSAFGGDNLGGFAWLKAPVALLDLPFSIAADTLCLPYDGYVVLAEPVVQEQPDASKPALQQGAFRTSRSESVAPGLGERQHVPAREKDGRTPK